MSSRADLIQITSLMPGAELIRAGKEQIALGFPEEVVKAWIRAQARPTVWVVPDVRSAGGVVQWSLEFPLYFFLFVQGGFGDGRKIRVVVAEQDWPDVVESLRLTLLGLIREEMERAGVAPDRAAALEAESAHMALKHPDGRIARIEDFLEPVFYDAEGMADLGTLQIRAHGDNTWSFFARADRIEEHRLECEPACPPWSLPPANAPVLPQPLELIALGTSTGFDPTRPCSNFLVQSHGRFLLVDAGPYVRHTLEHAGVSPEQLGAIFISHAHEDHAVGLTSLLGLTHRLKLFATRETAEILRRKLAICNPQVADPEHLLEDAFDWVPVEPGRAYDYMGLGMRIHDCLHSIPCAGVELGLEEGGQLRRILITGDNDARAHIEQARRAGVIDDARLASLTALYDWDGDLLVADAGGGQIHGQADDYRHSPAKTVVCVHTGSLDDALGHLFTLAEPGHRYTVIPERSRPSTLERGLAHRALAEAFGPDEPDWLHAMLDASEAETVNRGQVVIRCGDRSQNLYVALSGTLAVLVEREGRAEPVAKLQAGEIFGEMAAVRNAPRSASVRAETPCRLLRIPAAVFARFAACSKLVARLPEIWSRRADLESAGILASASVTTRNRFARLASRRTVAPGSTLIREGSRSNTVFVLVHGRAQVYKGASPLLVDGTPVIVEPGALIGETAPFLRKTRNASIVTLDECEVLAIRGRDFERIVRDSPQLFLDISRVVCSRNAEQRAARQGRRAA
ncbi:MAG: cyclic nucleotide-binding domain-containing protein [Deltaproteobacteria bacterium]|nr:cyclic nucleotide-binding domain-containing protein [Deltaproteobacteria bacterium]